MHRDNNDDDYNDDIDGYADIKGTRIYQRFPGTMHIIEKKLFLFCHTCTYFDLEVRTGIKALNNLAKE